MEPTTFYIKSLERFPAERPTDRLALQAGVNLIFGEKDAGKSRWLAILDYLLGDTDSATDALGSTISSKYESARVILAFSTGNEVSIERHWRQPKSLHKILIDGKAISSDSFDDWILSRLGIPILKYPRGNPFADKAGWLTLGWRSMFRSIFRQERFWAAFVEKQPDFETAACLLQFLGVADKQFPSSHERLAVEVRKLQKLEGQRDAFDTVLQTMTLDLLKQRDLNQAITSQSISASKQRIEAELQVLTTDRELLINNVTEAETIAFDQRYQETRSRRSRLDERRVSLIKESHASDQRIGELSQQIDEVKLEIARLGRVRKAGQVMSDIKVTRCPVCEEPTDGDEGDPNVCYLCGKRHLDTTASAESRLDFELHQLQEELDELVKLLELSRNGFTACKMAIDAINDEINDVDADLIPAIRLAITNVPPDFAVIDLRIGRLNEQISQLARVEQVLDEQSAIASNITELEREIEALRDELKMAHAEIDFRSLSRVLESGMNAYLDALNKRRPGLWTKGFLKVDLRPRSFDVTIRESSIDTELGAASNAIALFAYHYSLLRLSSEPSRHYPGIVILDFPLTLATGADLQGAENYLLEPFIELLSHPAFSKCQLLAAGRSFAGLIGAHQIEIRDAY